MAKKVEKVLIRNTKNKTIEPRECSKVEWEKGGSWKKDWELVDENVETGKGTKSKAKETPTVDVEKLESLKAEYKELHPEGKNVPNNKVKDVEWIEESIAEFKAEAKSEEE